MPSFVNFVLTFKNDHTAFGDVARDLAEDWCVKKSWGYKTLRKHIEKEHRPCDEFLVVLEELSVFYKLTKQRAQALPPPPPVVAPTPEQCGAKVAQAES